ncbi:MAG: hypothetical protein HFH05_06940 [Lachnospiraceae bacterium]|nr:hypothetical protein [Lachnospiraceae bacterium]
MFIEAMEAFVLQDCELRKRMLRGDAKFPELLKQLKNAGNRRFSSGFEIPQSGIIEVGMNKNTKSIKYA